MILALLNFKDQPKKKKQLFSPFLLIKKCHNYLTFFMLIFWLLEEETLIIQSSIVRYI